MNDPLQKETNWDAFYRERRKRGVMSVSINEWLDLKIKLAAAEGRVAELQAEVERLKAALWNCQQSLTPPNKPQDGIQIDYYSDNRTYDDLD